MCDMLDMSNYRALSACVIDTPDSLLALRFINIETHLLSLSLFVDGILLNDT